MAAQWHYTKDGQQSAPMTVEQLRAMIASGSLESTDLVWTERFAGWTPIHQVPELKVAPGTPSRVPPPPPSERTSHRGLIRCPACSREISTGANTCPGCGHEMRAGGATGIKMSDPIHAIGTVLGIGLFLFFIFGVYSCNSK